MGTMISKEEEYGYNWNGPYFNYIYRFFNICERYDGDIK